MHARQRKWKWNGIKKMKMNIAHGENVELKGIILLLYIFDDIHSNSSITLLFCVVIPLILMSNVNLEDDMDIHFVLSGVTVLSHSQDSHKKPSHWADVDAGTQQYHHKQWLQDTWHVHGACPNWLPLQMIFLHWVQCTIGNVVQIYTQSILLCFVH